jgi:hypothetical protein
MNYNQSVTSSTSTIVMMNLLSKEQDNLSLSFSNSSLALSSSSSSNCSSPPTSVQSSSIPPNSLCLKLKEEEE